MANRTTNWYPIMLDIEGKPCVVIGGGPVAERKARGLLEAGARVRVVSPKLTAGLEALAGEGKVEWRSKEADGSDLADAVLAFAAANVPEVNRRMTAAAREAGVPINAADEGMLGDFVLPAVLRRGRFVLTASASGAGPALASRVVRELAERYGPEYGDLADALARIRAVVKERVADPQERRMLLAAAAEAGAAQDWLRDGVDEDPQQLLERLRRLSRSKEIER